METVAAVKSNVEVVQNAFEDFSKGNIQGIVNVCTDNVVWQSYPNPLIPYAGLFEGKGGVMQFFKTLAEHVDYKEFQPKEFMSQGEHVFVTGYHKGTIKSTKKTFGHDWLMHFKLRNNQVYYYRVYVDSYDEAQAFTK